MRVFRRLMPAGPLLSVQFVEGRRLSFGVVRAFQESIDRESQEEVLGRTAEESQNQSQNVDSRNQIVDRFHRQIDVLTHISMTKGKETHAKQQCFSRRVYDWQ